MAIKICPKCGGKVSTERNLCIHCGYVFPSLKKCPDCGEECPLEANECPGCGHPFREGIVDPVAVEEEPAEAQGKVETPVYAEGCSAVANNDDTGVPVPKIEDDAPSDEEKPHCPYCHSEELMEIGKGYYLCLSCKMRFLDAGGDSGVSYVPMEAPCTRESESNDDLTPLSEKEFDGAMKATEETADVSGGAWTWMIVLSAFSVFGFCMMGVYSFVNSNTLHMLSGSGYTPLGLGFILAFALGISPALAFSIVDIVLAAKRKRKKTVFWTGIALKVLAMYPFFVLVIGDSPIFPVALVFAFLAFLATFVYFFLYILSAPKRR